MHVVTGAVDTHVVTGAVDTGACCHRCSSFRFSESLESLGIAFMLKGHTPVLDYIA